MTGTGAQELDWLTPLAERGPVPGLGGRLEVRWLVQKGPDGDLEITATFEPEPSGGAGDPAEVQLTSTHPIAVEIGSGALSPNVAWMTGRLKAAGPTGPLLAVLAQWEAASATSG